MVIIEGLKTMPFPRIAVFRNSLDENYFPQSNALAIDESIRLNDYSIPEHLDILDLNDTNALCAWIESNAQVFKES